MRSAFQKKWVLPVLATLLSFLGSLVLFEIAYRLAVFDFYRPELTAFNPKADLEDTAQKPTLLVLGDSFSAGNESYVNILRTKLPHLRIINSSIPGSGIVQTALIAKSRIQQFRPSLLMYQIYVGNDLFDITYPTNWEDLSLVRNFYWGMSNYLRSLVFLNYRLGQQTAAILANGYQPYKPCTSVYRSSDEFSPERFLNNEPLMLKADPQLIEKQILLIGERTRDFDYLVKKIQWLVSIKDPHCPFYVLVIPHACQVSKAYRERTKRLGGVFRNETLVEQDNYPFVHLLQDELTGCVILNPLPVFKDKEEAGIPLYWTNDVHLNPNGNEVLASYLSRILAGGSR
jgi:hypothetical protein